MKSSSSKTIVFITGAFVSSSCWDEWKKFFESNHYKTLAPCWPHKDAPAEVLRNRHPDAEVASLRLAALVDYYADRVARLPEKPILVGHSLGGLIVQLLLQRGLAVAGIAIHSVPPRGVITLKFSFLKAGWGALGFFTSLRQTYLMSFSAWQYAFTNGMGLEDQKAGYYKFVIPESKRIVRDTLTKAAKVDFSKPHPPLLLVSGSEDHLIPASLNYSNYKKYRTPGSVTDYKEFKGRTHFVLGQVTWREEANYILDWIGRQH
ncbi:MAG TPA: alpha/beta hydrolase [Puia sp.]